MDSVSFWTYHCLLKLTLAPDGPLPFLLSNTIVTIPFLFACALLFSLICYWAIGLHSGGGHFFRFLAYLFLALLGMSYRSFQIIIMLRPTVQRLKASTLYPGGRVAQLKSA